MLWRGWLLVLGMCCSGLAAAAPPSARITLLEGSATLHIAAVAYSAAAGVRLPAGTLVDTDVHATLLRIEWEGGQALDLGPDTHLMLAPPWRGPGTAPAFYLLRGWAKFSSPAARQGGLAPGVELLPVQGVVVAGVDAGQTLLFAEAGELALAERPGGRRRQLRAGELYQAATGRPGEQAGRPSAELLARLPRAFRDTLPLRLAAFNGRDVTPLPLPALRYAELQPWLVAEPALRQGFPARFASRLAEREFRSALAGQLRLHPEWAPLLAPPRRPGVTP